MSESDPSGYGDSPDTTDGPVADDQQETAGTGASDATLTTDSEAQLEGSVLRPGNEPD
jgi:hypothetical protein